MTIQRIGTPFLLRSQCMRRMCFVPPESFCSLTDSALFIKRRSFLKRSSRAAAAAGVINKLLSIARYRFQVNRCDIPLAGLPPQFEGFTIVHLTDLHYGPLMPLAVIRHLA